METMALELLTFTKEGGSLHALAKNEMENITNIVIIS
jgi:hypothetical protein